MSTIHDIAKLAGVSKSTVSNVLNDRQARFSEATRQRVLRAVDKLNYRPNAVARSLVLQNTRSIGVLMSDITRDPYAMALRAAERTFAKHQYNVIVSNSNRSVSGEEKALNQMLDYRIDGILFVSHSGTTENNHLTELSRSNFPLVMINRFFPEKGIDAINIDNAGGIEKAVCHLAELGHRRIACVRLPIDGKSVKKAGIERWKGFERGMLRAGLPIKPKWVLDGLHGVERGIQSGYEHALDLLRQGERPTAVVCANDYLAIGVARAAESLGISLPEELSITGHDDTVAGRYVTPALTTIAQPMAGAAKKGAEQLIERLKNNSPDRVPFELILEGRLIKRESTASVHM